MTFGLIAPDEPAPVLSHRRNGRSRFVIVVDHASRRIPRRMRNLGLAESDLNRHIAWDIGALAVAKGVSDALDAPLVAQNYSRLVIDCNRRTDDPTSIPTVSDLTPIAGNVDLSDEEAEVRRREIFEPYHGHLRALLDERMRSGRATILILQHSMTPVFMGIRREMHAAVLHDEDNRFARCLLDALRSQQGLIVGDNEPYSGKQRISFTSLHHGEARAVAHVEIEIRQDLISSATGQAEWTRRMTTALCTAEQVFVNKYA